MKDQHISDKSRGFIIKYGPIYGKIVSKLAAPVVAAAVAGETGSKGAGKAAGKVTEQGIQYWWKGIALIAKLMAGPIRTWQQKIESKYYFDKMYPMGPGESHDNNPRCRDLKSMAQSKRLGLTEDKPKPMYLVVYNIDKKAGKDYEILFNKNIYPMGPDPAKGKYYTGKGKARGGPFASWIITARYEDTPVFVNGVPVKDKSGNLVIDPDTGDFVTEKIEVMDPKTGKQKIQSKLVADLHMLHDRGGVERGDCRTAGNNPGNAPDQGGTWFWEN